MFDFLISWVDVHFMAQGFEKLLPFVLSFFAGHLHDTACILGSLSVIIDIHFTVSFCLCCLLILNAKESGFIPLVLCNTQFSFQTINQHHLAVCFMT
jgi:hypothetical protein